MDKLKIELSYDVTPEDEQEASYKFLCVDMYLNDMRINKAVSLYDILHKVSGENEIFTCSCGHAGCAGIWEGVRVKFRKHTVEWRIPHNAGYDFLDKRFYSFSRNEWDDMCSSIRTDLKELAKLDVQDQFSHWPDDFYKLSNRLKNYGVK